MNNDSEDQNRYRKTCAENPLCSPNYLSKAVEPHLTDVLFVNYNKAEGCPYAMPFGHGFICNCEERKDFYKKHGK